MEKRLSVGMTFFPIHIPFCIVCTEVTEKKKPLKQGQPIKFKEKKDVEYNLCVPSCI